MKVLIVSNTYPPADISGVGSLAQELLEGLSEQAQLQVLTRTASQNDDRVRGTGGPKVLFPLLAAWRARLPSTAPDVVHVNESDGVVIALSIWLRRKLRLKTPKLAATFQVSYRREAVEVRDVIADGTVVSRPKRSERIFKYFRAPLLELAGKITARLADRIVACSNFTVDELEADYGINRQAMVAIANGIRVPAHQDRSTAVPDQPLKALYVGRLRTRKAVAVALIALTKPGAENVHFTVVGDGEQSEALRDQVITLGLERRVTFAGRLTREQVLRQYEDADVFVLPSTYEGFPVAILEAMGAGLPIIATRVAGIPEAFDDGESGILVEPEDATALASAIAELESDRQRCRAMGRRAYQRVSQDFSIEHVGAQYLELWRSMSDAGS